MLSKKLKSNSESSRKYRQNRRFSEEFKRDKVKEIESKRLKVSQICDLYEVTSAAVYKWLYKYGQKTEKGVKIVIEMESEAIKTKHLQERVAELERIIGQKQLEIDYLNKLLDLESQELGYDLKKKHVSKLSNILGGKNKTMII